ncbi:hypothetical protein B296_00014351 [Ensete ventricosum]|uniref:Uncharacterized protein n=1 Tax=Ensete ventricosum TaxID=4639 RepID=A0A427B4Q6_ENSVE|nr:hypothetical protein B296_00014351 [Ensete ventricosum]
MEARFIAETCKLAPSGKLGAAPHNADARGSVGARTRCTTMPSKRKPPVCARPPASQSLRHRVELVRMSGDSGLSLGGLMLEWGSPGDGGVVQLGSAADSCKEVGSGRFPT